ncbi:MAG: glycoside hydrolase [Nitrosomonas sp.]|nr:glycoside hydrolase [Nitrosomonas sp.]
MNTNYEVLRIRIIPSLSITTKHKYHVTLITLLFFMSIMPVLWGAKHAVGATPPVVTTPVKWHPGHYYTIMSHGKNNSWYLSQVYKELKATSALRGMQVRYRWPELETTEGVYNFSSIAKRLSELSAMNKRLVIVIETKAFGPDEEIVPDYVKTSPYEGGTFVFDNNTIAGQGENIKLWNPLIRDRLAALMRALGNRFNSNPYFEGIGLSETAIGQAVIPLSSAQLNNYYAALLSIQQQMRNSFPNTVTFQFTNFPRPILESFINGLNDMGVGLGGPDVLLDDPGLNYPKLPQGVYNYYPKYSGILPLTPSVMHSNYRNTRADKTGYEPTISELLSFARDTLKANYIFWTRDPDYYREVLQMLNLNAQENTPEGGLDPTCPSVYSSCVN